jgi:ribose transport system ATP-binding protein
VIVADDNDILLQLKSICKQFPGVQALDNVDMEIRRGEIHALVGENGAGKSTLIKVLAGVHQQDAGEIIFKGQSVQIPDPHAAQQLGITVIFQELSLVPVLTVAQNVMLGRLPTTGGVIRGRELNERVQGILSNIGFAIPPDAVVENLKMAERQMVEIAKALSLDAALVIMDEPTAPLTRQETEQLFAVTRQLKASGVSVLYISHLLDEIFEIADRVTVLKDGHRVQTANVKDTNKGELVRWMIGHELRQAVPISVSNIGAELLRVENVTRAGVLRDVSLTVRQGEIVGLSGLVGSGRTELARCIFGIDRIDSGQLYVQGRKVTIHSAADALKNGIGFVTEDRKGEGLVLKLAVRSNVTLANLPAISHFGVLDFGTERRIANEFKKKLNIVTPSIEQLVRNLSGGNQQKTVLAKWLCRQLKVLIIDEPTVGIDVGARDEIYQILEQLTKEGLGILMISSDLPEVLRMSTRVIVMRDGQVAADFGTQRPTQDEVMSAATGGAL